MLLADLIVNAYIKYLFVFSYALEHTEVYFAVFPFKCMVKDRSLTNYKVDFYRSLFPIQLAKLDITTQ